jgi:acyl-CoA synthetase (AMP-forming)/AMP-acid ligase II
MDFMNSDKFIFIWFGLWAIGAKPAFINYNLTDKAFIHCINVSASRLVLIDPQVQHRITQEIRDQLPNVLCEVFSPEFEAEVMSTVGVREHNSTRSEDKVSNLGMIVFTSGTTGLPKGAVVSWNKIVLGSMIVHGWSGFGQDDTFYTVSFKNSSGRPVLMYRSACLFIIHQLHVWDSAWPLSGARQFALGRAFRLRRSGKTADHQTRQ